MPLILYKCASDRFCHKPPNWVLMINATFKFTSSPKRWLVGSNVYSIILTPLMIFCSKNYFPISLLHFVPTFLITLHMKDLIRNQSDRLTPQSLHSTLTIQLTFSKYFFALFILYATPKFYHNSRVQNKEKGRLHF